ncbi:MAG: hypothetical protein RL768_2598 [Nitrospirota bacterium]|jgi:hypothetical protein
MRQARRRSAGFAVIAAVVASWTPAQAQVAPGDPVGLYTAVQGTVAAQHVGRTEGVPVRLQEPVLFQDLIETQRASRMKALFQDDTLLTIGPKSKVQITEYVFDPAKGRRSAVVEMTQGAVRSLVGKTFVDVGSRYEVRTPTAVAAARGTYFVVWIQEETGATGVANIGDKGQVEVTSGGQSVMVGPKEMAIVTNSGSAPTPPAPIPPSSDPAAAAQGVTEAIATTIIQEMPPPESPLETVVKTTPSPTTAVPVPTTTAFGSPLAPKTSQMPIPYTPPAIISGAAGTTPVTLTIVVP